MSRLLILASSFGFCLVALSLTGIEAGISPAKSWSGSVDMIDPEIGPGQQENVEEPRAQVMYVSPCGARCLCPALYSPVCGFDPHSQPPAPAYRKYGNMCQLNCDKMQCKPNLKCIDGNKNTLFCPAEPSGYTACPTQ